MIDFGKIEKILIGEPAFRKKQVKHLAFRDLIESWEEATTLPKALREKLAQECPLEIKAEVFPDKDGRSVKALMALEDGLSVETVLMRYGSGAAGASFSTNHPIPVPPAGGTPVFTRSQPRQLLKDARIRNTICVSSQIGCPLGCAFCATGKIGFKRNLIAGEIVEQVLFWARYLKKPQNSHSEERSDEESVRSFAIAQEDKKEDSRVNNVVFMGMGEPFLNYDNVFGAIKILNDDNLLGIGSRHISISTVGIIEGIERMAEDMPQINLAISLHAANDELRQKLMPIAKKYPLARLMAVANDYVAKTNRKLMFEYIMIKNLNDLPEHARQLVKILKEPLYFVNLIAYNSTGVFEPSPKERIKKFKDILMKAGIQALERYRFGQAISGACGQLRGER